MNYQFKTMDEVRAAVRAGREVFWSNESYIVLEEPISDNPSTRERQEQFEAVKDGKMLVARCKSNWFGGCLEPQEVGSCFVVIA